MKTKYILVSLCVSFIFVACDYNLPINKEVPAPQSLEQFVDARDGNVYKYVTIGNQVWMAENLRYVPVNVSLSPYYDHSYNTEKYYAYSDNPSNIETYGVLYNAVAAKKASPTGWRLPTDEDFRELQEYVKSAYSSHTNAWIPALLDPTSWNADCMSSEYLNRSGFHAVGSGYFEYHGKYFYLNYRAYYYYFEYSLLKVIAFDPDDVYSTFSHVSNDVEDAYAIRCIKE